MDSSVMESVKRVEEACSWFLKEHPSSRDIEKCSRGLVVVAQHLRKLMIYLEQENPDEGILTVPIYEHAVDCGNHKHILAIFFTSKGEFYPGAGMELENMQREGVVFPTKMSPTMIIRMGIPARELVEGIKRATHTLVRGGSAVGMPNMPMAQA